MKLYKGVKNRQGEVGVVDFDRLTVGDAYPGSGSIVLTCGTYNGNWYEASAEDEDGNEYKAIWTEVDWDADGGDACDWDNPDYILNEYGYDFIPYSVDDLVNDVSEILETIDYKISKQTIKDYIESQGAESLDAQTIVYYIRLYNITD